jgi:hypothetical protein
VGNPGYSNRPIILHKEDTALFGDTEHNRQALFKPTMTETTAGRAKTLPGRAKEALPSGTRVSPKPRMRLKPESPCTIVLC